MRSETDDEGLTRRPAPRARDHRAAAERRIVSEAQNYGTAAVVAPHPAAAAAARDVLIEGGSAVEAAVAAAAASAVVLPDRGGLAGDGMWLIHEAGRRGKTRIIDARGPAGEAASLRSYRDREQESIPVHGGDAVLTVPGSIAGWHAALDFAAALGARLPLRRLLEPAVRLAREGFAAAEPIGLAPAMLDALRKVPGFATTCLVEDAPPAPGTVRTAPRLAETLAYLAHAGLDDAYRGDVGREIGSDLERLGSPLGRADLRRFEARWRQPRELRCGAWRIEAPPTGRALLLLITMGLLDRLPASRPESLGEVHALMESFGRAATMMASALEGAADPDDLLSAARLVAESEEIDAKRPTSPPAPAGPAEDGIVIGVIDRDGLAVALVQSIGTSFGSGLVLPGTGLLMGNRGAAFALTSDRGLVLRSGRRAPMGSLPVLVRHDDGRVAVLGAAGAGGAAVAALAAHRLLTGTGLSDAIAAPRLVPGLDPRSDQPTWLAEDTIDPSVAAGLRHRGHPVETAGAAGFGEAGGVLRVPRGRIEVAPEPRRCALGDGL